MFTLETVGELNISKFIKQVFLGSDLGKLGRFWQVPDVTLSRPASCVTLPTFVVGPWMLKNKDVNLKLEFLLALGLR